MSARDKGQGMADNQVGHTIQEMAEALGLSTQTVRRHIRQGLIPAVQPGGPNGKIICLSQPLIDAMERSLNKSYAIAEDRAEAEAERENQRLSQLASDKAVAEAKKLVDADRKYRESASPVFA
jgi:excisionase family DNA binding protein